MQTGKKTKCCNIVQIAEKGGNYIFEFNLLSFLEMGENLPKVYSQTKIRKTKVLLRGLRLILLDTLKLKCRFFLTYFPGEMKTLTLGNSFIIIKSLRF